MDVRSRYLLALARRLGVEVQLTGEMSAVQRGAWVPSQNVIYVAEDLDSAQRAVTLAHELAHVILAQDERQDAAGEERADALAAILLGGA